MKTFYIATLAGVIIGGFAIPALASTYSGSCTSEPQSKWLSTAAVQQQYQKQGYTVRRVKAGGTCYEVYAVDKAGAKVEFFVNPATGALVQQAGKPAAKPAAKP
ncbi:MAG TPA: PepSY domain-containing protein [Rhodanobacteraceae bacterium]|nr:PepSY domain-containing protein [Rhodanobacteraceae bacterium]